MECSAKAGRSCFGWPDWAPILRFPLAPFLRFFPAFGLVMSEDGGLLEFEDSEVIQAAPKVSF